MPILSKLPVVFASEEIYLLTCPRYDKLTIAVGNIRVNLQSQVEAMLNEVVNFKMHIQDSLQAYEDLVTREGEDECRAQDEFAAAEAAEFAAEQEIESR